MGSSVRQSRRGDISRNEFPVPFKVSPSQRIVPVNPFENDLVFARPVEAHGGQFAKVGGLVQHARGDAAGQQIDEVSVSSAGFYQGAIVDNHGQRARELPRDGHGEIVAAPGHQGDFDSPGGGFGDRVPVDLGQLGPLVKERPVNIERNQADWHLVSLPCPRPLGPDS